MQENVERAQELMDALCKGDLSAGLHERLVDWFLNSPENEDFEEAISQWAAINIKPDTSKPDKKEREKFRRLIQVLNIRYDAAGGIKTPVRRFFEGGFAERAAAVLVPVLIAVGAALLTGEERGRVAGIEFYDVTEVVLEATGDSRREEFTLPDGTKVNLAASSKLMYASDFPAGGRKVRLDGEAMFDVTHDSANPFTVAGEQMSVRVLGTQFRLTAWDNAPEAEVVLLTGSVSVELGAECHHLAPGRRMTLDRAALAVVGQEELSAGEMARLSGADLEIYNTHAEEALGIVADYYGMGLAVDGGVGLKSYLNIVLPHRVLPERAMEILSQLSDEANFEIRGDAIHVSKK
jgi:ferric-dicitrate binding protein FerR (iron transport regulator)